MTGSNFPARASSVKSLEYFAKKSPGLLGSSCWLNRILSLIEEAKGRIPTPLASANALVCNLGPLNIRIEDRVISRAVFLNLTENISQENQMKFFPLHCTKKRGKRKCNRKWSIF
jgi:hypothetical protein